MIGLQGADINWGLIVPVLFIQLFLIVWSLMDLVKRDKTRGPKWFWALFILFFTILGPILYIFVGRKA